MSAAWLPSGRTRAFGTRSTLGLLLIMAGFLFQWPTVLTILMFPMLAFAYARLAISEEREVRAEFGVEFEDYAAKTPRFIPRLGLGNARPVGTAGLDR